MINELVQFVTMNLEFIRAISTIIGFFVAGYIMITGLELAKYLIVKHIENRNHNKINIENEKK